MNGHNHVILLLQDLEDDDQDIEYQASYSSTNNHPSFLSKADPNFPKTSGLLQVPSDPKVANPSHPKMLSSSCSFTSYSSNGINTNGSSPSPPTLLGRRKSISADNYNNSWNSYGESSVNNAITVVPSRNSLEPNVFVGGRATPIPGQGHHHKKQGHRKHKGRSKSPTKDDSGTTTSTAQGPGSILDRIDNSILKNFGDWNALEEEGRRSNNSSSNNNNLNSNCDTQRSNAKRTPYYIPKKKSFEEAEYPPNSMEKGLPKLYKNYDSVVKNTKQILNDKSYRIALSKDNNDPNSILSEAKRTLSRFGGEID